MPLLPAKPLADVPPGSMAEFETSSATFALCNVNGVIYCIDGVCPHAQGPLAQGALHGETVVCPWHGWEFNARTGAGEGCTVSTYPAVVQDGLIYIDVSEA